MQKMESYFSPSAAIHQESSTRYSVTIIAAFLPLAEIIRPRCGMRQVEGYFLPSVAIHQMLRTPYSVTMIAAFLLPVGMIPPKSGMQRVVKNYLL